MQEPGTAHPQEKIAVLDFGGQYAHLIASRIRRLGAYTEIEFPDDFDGRKAAGYHGIVLSGGPESVYEPGAPSIDDSILAAGVPVLGICYGHHLMMHSLGGKVIASGTREYGAARIHWNGDPDARGIFGSLPDESVVWMSHGDEVEALPPGFEVLGSTPDCRFAALGDLNRNLFSIQFHPEVSHTEIGDDLLSRFIDICGLRNSWKLKDFLQAEQARIQSDTTGRKVFFLVSGGVDSTVAYTLLAESMPEDHLRGLLVDTGFLRKEESSQVLSAIHNLGLELMVHDASEQFFAALKGQFEPEKKRKIIGDLFLEVQAEYAKKLGLQSEEWILGQGTIYPDTIESGSTKSSHTIKTHHNRVEAIARMIEEGRVIEPLAELYKDEVRQLGRLLGLPEHLVDRHPFPGPGLAVRCLCTPEDPSEHEGYEERSVDLGTLVESSGSIQELLDATGIQAQLLPVLSVGVQGDKRTYAHPVALFQESRETSESQYDSLLELATMIPNRVSRANRVVLSSSSPGTYRLKPGQDLNRARIENLQLADAIVKDFLEETGLYQKIWQFPVVLLPVYRTDDEARRECIVLRPVHSRDAMTASPYMMEADQLQELVKRILNTDRFGDVMLDLTSKPPGTIEWE
ncbi:MAG TPA: glutamine-hydrolyzing GMP synthase [Leptospiraceae bacterium]|nr:glutamine-hydrolyzing GMP synthase [Spirochaetaceae bacterium]HBS03613.1 glutamine-hydrolyzing GMP synthase [Leptospiraceae bacterium]|tara:strand:+ start:33688 stop:35577 length:1890 start_codon:yes stop_codon:yes gene_type:complete